MVVAGWRILNPPVGLDDIDSINFALGIQDFDVAAHRPHPPGYPIIIALGKLAAAVGGGRASALAFWSGLAAALAPFPLLALFSRLEPGPSARSRAVLATLLTVVQPILWFTAGRPMSDLPGLFAALCTQALLVAAFQRGRAGAVATADAGRLIVAGALAAGLSIGFRSQNAWLTLPITPNAFPPPAPSR